MEKTKYDSAFEWIESLATGLVIIVLVFVFVFKIYTIFGDSMYPTLSEPQRVMVWQLLYSPKGGDIVVVDSSNNYGKTLIKRVVATENQTIFIDQETGELFVDGVSMGASVNNIGGDQVYPLTVPEGCCFLMGDNRAVSLDSRSEIVGIVSNDYIVGKVLLRVFPFNSFGVVE